MLCKNWRSEWDICKSISSSDWSEIWHEHYLHLYNETVRFGVSFSVWHRLCQPHNKDSESLRNLTTSLNSSENWDYWNLKINLMLYNLRASIYDSKCRTSKSSTKNLLIIFCECYYQNTRKQDWDWKSIRERSYIRYCEIWADFLQESQSVNVFKDHSNLSYWEQLWWE